jgi:predicted nucleic acid-binding protein
VSDVRTRRTVVVDANIVINLLHAERLALLGAIPEYDFVIPEDVVAEIVDPAQRTQLDRAIADGLLRVETITELDDLVQYAEFRRGLGRGEAACLVLAKRHTWLVASDEKGRFQRESVAALGTGRTINTAGLFVVAIRAGVMSIEEADQAKSVLERHRFRLPFSSFRDVVSGSS